MRRKTIAWTPEQRAQHRVIRDAFREWHPGPEELIASGAAARIGLNVVHSPAQELLRNLKASREAAGLTLADVSARCGIDQDDRADVVADQLGERFVDLRRVRPGAHVVAELPLD